MRTLQLSPVLGDKELGHAVDYAGKRVALFFNHSMKHITGHYVHHALNRMCDVRLYHPSEAFNIKNDFDLHVFIDDSFHYIFPRRLKPSALWLVDTHLTLSFDYVMAMNFDIVFCAQKNGALRLIDRGFKNVYWLPLACDPDYHYSGQVPWESKTYDIGFVGNAGSGFMGNEFRKDLLSTIKIKYPNSFIGNAEHSKIGQIYSKSKVVFNISVRNDLNMRLFEGLCSGSAVLTDSVSDMNVLFSDHEHLFLYHSKEEALSKVEYLLQNPSLSAEVAARGRQQALQKHTYQNRTNEMMRICFNADREVVTHDYRASIMRIVSKSEFLQRIMLIKFFNAWIFLPLADPSLFIEMLHAKIVRTLKSARKRLKRPAAGVGSRRAIESRQ